MERYDSVFGIKKLDGSNVHIYSVLFTLEIFKYIVREYAKNHEEEYSIGIVCPYSPQAQLIESLIMQTPNIPVNVKITVGKMCIRDRQYIQQTWRIYFRELCQGYYSWLYESTGFEMGHKDVHIS